ncbi:MAG: hypothetical protein GC164_14180 [Phycisphaera sp.]|nr:hypothetical protein [Phycisphaera sp.]
MVRNHRFNKFPLALVVVMICSTVIYAGAIKPEDTEPDYTKGETTGERYEGKGCWNYINLGPVGARGELWMGRHTTVMARTTRVMEVLEGTPAEGVLKVNDVILGVGDSKFSSDVRKEISAAITGAETKEGDGKIDFLIYRPQGDPKDGKGSEMKVTVKIPVLGTYSDTAPWDDAKSQKIIDNMCNYIVTQGFFKQVDEGQQVVGGGIPGKLEALGLLATGEEKYLPLVKTYVRQLADSWKDRTFTSSWFTSYDMILLTEYYLATQDEYVLPTINNVARQIAQGASDVGTFSHGPAKFFTAYGKEWKYPSAYGAMNQCSLTCSIALVLARKCGVRDPEVDRVIQKEAYFYKWFVDKGAIPYGDHPPVENFDNNGVNSQAAVLYNLLGDKEATEYYTRETLASYNVREMGHTGHFFSWQWGALGANCGGDAAAQSFVKNTQWFTELERRPNGGFKYQPQLSNLDHGHYLSWSTTGSRLLQFCLPRKKLYITGKGGLCIAPITGDDLKAVASEGMFDPRELPTQELLKSLTSHSPIVRNKAAKELGKRDEDVASQLVTMLDSPDRYARYGACEGLSYAGRGSEQAIDALINVLEKDDDLTVRYYAANAFRKRWDMPNALGIKGGAIDKAIPALLKQVAIYEPEKDPLGKLARIISDTLFYGGSVRGYSGLLPKGKGVETVDPKVLIPAIKALLQNPNGAARTNVSCVFDRLTQDELKQVWGDIYYATKYQSPSGSMEAGGVRGNGLKLMADHGVEEGIPVGIDWALRQEGWGNAQRKKSGVPSLLQYGAALKAYVPEIVRVLAGWGENHSKNSHEGAKEFEAKLTETLKNPAPKLKSIQPYIDATPDPLAPAQQSEPKQEK